MGAAALPLCAVILLLLFFLEALGGRIGDGGEIYETPERVLSAAAAHARECVFAAIDARTSPYFLFYLLLR